MKQIMDNISGLFSHPSTFLIKDSRFELIKDSTLANSNVIFSSEIIPTPQNFFI